MQKLIFFYLLIYPVYLTSAQSFGPPKWQIVYVKQKPIQVKDIDVEIMEDKLVLYLEQFENTLSKKYGKQFDNCYRKVRFAGEGKRTIIVYLIPTGLDTKENWLKINYHTKEQKVHQLYYDIRNRTLSPIGYRYPLPL